MLIAEHVSACRAAPPAGTEGPRLLLLSGHDTSLLAILNALEHTVAGAGQPAVPPLVSDDEWPPHTASIAIELLSDGKVRVLYQFEELVAQPVEPFLKGMRRLAASDAQHARWCGDGDGEDGAVFNWSD